MTDAEWLADVAAHGMVRPSFVPPPPIRELRELTRYQERRSRGRDPTPGEGAPGCGDQADLGRVEGPDGVGRAMIEALIAGERDGAKLSELAIGKMRPKVPALTEALTGHFGFTTLLRAG